MSEKDDVLEITIHDFEKYRARHDVTRPWYFKCSTDIGTSRALWNMNASERFAWVCLLAYAHSQGSSLFRFKVKVESKLNRIRPSTIRSMIFKANKNKLLSVKSVTDP